LTFEVWAPLIEKVELVLDGERHAMEKDDAGWWRAEADGAPGMRYGYSLDGANPLPDPRSPDQPDGVHGLSAVIDHDAFQWRDEDWWGTPVPQWVVYELHVGTFTPEGTFRAAIEKLDHLVELGVTAVELLPVASFAGRHGWGYDGVDLYAPHRAYGAPDDLKALVDALHERGMIAILDVVYNHLGPAGNYLGRFGPYFTNVYATPWGDALNFTEAYADEVKRFFIDNALMWLTEYHFDALRLDAVHAILDTSAKHLLEELAEAVARRATDVGRPLHLLPETDLNDPRLVRPIEDGGLGLDVQWSDDFHHALHSVLTGERNGYYEDFGTIAQLAKAIRQSYVFDGNYSVHRKRRHGRPPAGLTGHSFMAYMQNHDQIGNRATGDRIHETIGPELTKVGAALYLTSPFIPMLFQGEEWAASSPFRYFTDHDAELGKLVSEGRKREFGYFGWDPDDVPDPQSSETFEISKLKWDEIGAPEHSDMLDWYKRLTRLRLRKPALTNGDLSKIKTVFDEDARWLVVLRGTVTIAANLSDAPASLSVARDRRAELLLASKDPERNDDELILAPRSVAIFNTL
jgi:maltooligosyltrehalose trehalohydrolase